MSSGLIAALAIGGVVLWWASQKDANPADTSTGNDGGTNTPPTGGGSAPPVDPLGVPPPPPPPPLDDWRAVLNHVEWWAIALAARIHRIPFGEWRVIAETEHPTGLYTNWDSRCDVKYRDDNPTIGGYRFTIRAPGREEQYAVPYQQLAFSRQCYSRQA